MARRKLLVEGWRFLPHSYAMVNQWQLLALAKRDDIDLRVRDLPLYRPSWKAGASLLDPERDRQLRAVPPASAEFSPDATLRFSFPFDLSPPRSGRLAVICPSEYQVYQADAWTAPNDPAALALRHDLTVIAPSRWSAAGLERSSIPAARIAMVPHGVDSSVFAPDRDSGSAMRARLGIGAGVVFMNAGAMTANKGADLLLRGFAELCRQRADVYLLLKGTDELYRSNARLGVVMSALDPALRALVGSRIVYGGTTLSVADMAALYRAADVYVSPYRAEGFNLPVLEAMASGLPVICTAGGPTDDFVPDEAGLKIASRTVAAAMPDGAQGVQLQPDLSALTRLMLRAAQDSAWRAAAGRAARLAAAKMGWDGVVDRLLEVAL
jgi:glycosyltransferase involved in cell wall biosynthesis